MKTLNWLDALCLRICLVYFHPVRHFFIMLLVMAPCALAPFAIAGQFSIWSVIWYLIGFPVFYETVLKLIFRYSFDGRRPQQVWEQVLAGAEDGSGEEEFDDEATMTNPASTNKRT